MFEACTDLGFRDLRPRFFNNNNNWINFPLSYQDIIGKGISTFTGDNNNKNNYFKLKEIEVFRIS